MDGERNSHPLYSLSTPTLTLKPTPSSVKWLNMVKGATCVSQTGNPQPNTANRCFDSAQQPVTPLDLIGN
jgi:hypothetical protein